MKDLKKIFVLSSCIVICAGFFTVAASAQGRIAPGSLRIVAGASLLRTFAPPDGWPKTFCSGCGSALWSEAPDDPEMKPGSTVRWVCRILLASVRPLPTRLGARSLRSRAPSRVVRSGLRCLAEASGRACDSAARPDDHQQGRHEPTPRWIQAETATPGPGRTAPARSGSAPRCTRSGSAAPRRCPGRTRSRSRAGGRSASAREPRNP